MYEIREMHYSKQQIMKLEGWFFFLPPIHAIQYLTAFPNIQCEIPQCHLGFLWRDKRCHKTFLINFFAFWWDVAEIAHNALETVSKQTGWKICQIIIYCENNWYNMNFNKFRSKSRYCYNIPWEEDFNNNERWAKRYAYTLVCPHAKRLCDFTHNQKATTWWNLWKCHWI